MATKVIGESLLRKEDRRFLLGKGTFVEDISLPGTLWMAFVRSPHAHARIRSIDKSAALAHPGILAVYTWEDLHDRFNDLPAARLSFAPDMQSVPVPLLAHGKVKFVGETVAAVVAKDRYLARDGADLVKIDYELLKAVVDPEESIKSDAPRIHDELRGNVSLKWHFSAGDVAKAFEEADVVIRERLVNHRVHPVPMEPRACLASWDQKEGKLIVYAATQGAQGSKSGFMNALKLREHQIQVIVPDVGGGFGAKHSDTESFVLAAASMMLVAPVKWVATRSEDFVTMNYGRGKTSYIDIAAKKDGTVTAMRLRHIGDLGAYAKGAVPATHIASATISPGVYNIRNIEIDLTSVHTNKTFDGGYRGFGRPEGIYVIERAMDILAEKLKMDPAELRRKNLIPKDAFPYKTATGELYDSGDYEAALNRALELSEYHKLKKEQAQARKEGRYIGIGLSCYVKSGGAGPHPILPMGGGWEVGRVRIDRQGKVTVITGTSPHGQGIETAFSQIVAEVLGVPWEEINITWGDTSVMPYGAGTFGSRSLAVGGPAVYNAAQKLKDKAQRIAANKLGVAVDQIAFENGTFHVTTQPDKKMSLMETVQAAYYGLGLPAGMEPGMDELCFFQPASITYCSGTHICEVEVDVDTGDVKILKYVSVDDAGKVVNPIIVDGQVHGGVAQSIGQVLFERAVYDKDGQLLSGTFMDYAMPTAELVPNFITDRVESPSPLNPLGAKGFGEAPNTGAPPAIVNAVVDALKPFGIHHIEMPLTSERVWEAIQNSKKGVKA